MLYICFCISNYSNNFKYLTINDSYISATSREKSFNLENLTYDPRCPLFLNCICNEYFVVHKNLQQNNYHFI